MLSQVEKLMEKLEESEPKRRRTIKTFIVGASVVVSQMFFGFYQQPFEF